MFQEKFLCLVNYFIRSPAAPPTNIKFVRKQYQGEAPTQLIQQAQRLTRFEIKDGGLERSSLLHSDFANKYIGGGVLRRGCGMVHSCTMLFFTLQFKKRLCSFSCQSCSLVSSLIVRTETQSAAIL
jgi:hypothetical protein